jgi:hypothetical protein
MRPGPLSAASVLAGCLVCAALAAQVSDPVSFKRDIVPLLKVRCAVCHLTGDEAGHMALHPAAAYKNLVGVASVESPLLRVKPGAPDQSYIVAKLEGRQIQAGGQGVRMPMDGDPLTADEVQQIRRWIGAGARDD